jgi:uncharacterized protein with PQ loop repeat
MTHPIHHYHKRKRGLKNISPLKKFLDRSIYVVGILGPIMSIPQAQIIWEEKNAQSLSLLTWTSYLFIGIIWLIYGIVHKERPIVITYLGWFVVHIVIIVGILLYG